MLAALHSLLILHKFRIKADSNADCTSEVDEVQTEVNNQIDVRITEESQNTTNEAFALLYH